MKKRFITIIVVILVIIAIVAFGFILGGMLDKGSKVDNNTLQNDVLNNGNSSENEIGTEGQSVVLNSKVGTDVLAKFYMPILYSNYYYNELYTNKLSDKTKLLYTYIQISKNPNYFDMLRIAEDYSGNYIINKDMETVMGSYFSKVENITHQNVIGDNSYNKEAKQYIIVPMGFSSQDMEYIVEVPYKIIEYNDRVEVFFYSLYGINKIINEENEEIIANIYYNKSRTDLAFTTKDEKIFDDDEIISFLNDRINKNEIDKEKIKKVKYTLKKSKGTYLIDNFEEL